MAQLISITSEALQATIRRLLPSQQGFGEDLQASNVITPIIDLTPAAEDTTRQDLQTALAFGSQTALSVSAATSTINNNPGFFRFFGSVNLFMSGSSVQSVDFSLTDGLSTTKIIEYNTINNTAAGTFQCIPVDFIVFFNSGVSMSCTATNAASFVGSRRQIATLQGEFVNPQGYTPQ